METTKHLTVEGAVKAFYGTSAYETKTNFFIKGCSMCHGTDITFVIPRKEIKVDQEGNPIVQPFLYYGADNNFDFISDPNMDFYGFIRFYFGDFCRTEEGLIHFTPKHPGEAENLLVIVCSLDGDFIKRHGDSPDQKLDGVKYFQRTDNYDYWVIPFGFSKALYSDGSKSNKIDWQSLRSFHATQYDNKFS